jgi:hypothetical protein
MSSKANGGKREMSHLNRRLNHYIAFFEFNRNGRISKAEGVMNGCVREKNFGRRGVLKLVGKLLGVSATFAGLGASLGVSRARAKTSQAGAAYRGSPNGRQRCANCSWFEPPSGCGVVRGPVSANSWCKLWG